MAQIIFKTLKFNDNNVKSTFIFEKISGEHPDIYIYPHTCKSKNCSRQQLRKSENDKELSSG